MRENKLSIHIEIGNFYYEGMNTNEIIYDFILAQQDDSKKLLDADLKMLHHSHVSPTIQQSHWLSNLTEIQFLFM